MTTDHLRGHPIGLLLIGIVRRADGELGLNQTRHGAIASHALLRQDIGRPGATGVEHGALDAEPRQQYLLL